MSRPPIDPDLKHLIEDLNGFVYHGDRLNAIVETIDWLRANPDAAARLLGQKIDRLA